MASQMPLIYRIWFHYFEPFAAINGAYLAYFRPTSYLQMTSFPIAETSPIPESTTHVLSHIAALYLYFGVLEAVGMRMTGDLRILKTLVFTMLFSDFAYLWAIHGLGPHEGYWMQPWLWTGIDWGNFGISWAALFTRLAFLAGVGLPKRR